MNALPREADEIVGRVLQRATGPHLDFLRPIVSWRGTRGDTLVLRRFVHWADSTLRHGTTAQRTAAYVLVSTSAYLALARRSEEHTSELQSLAYLVCRLLLEKKKKNRKELSTQNKIRQHNTDYI